MAKTLHDRFADSLATGKLLDWRENLALLVEYTRREALALEEIARALRGDTRHRATQPIDPEDLK